MHLIANHHLELLDQKPAVVQIQRDLMYGWGFTPAKRDGDRVLWEMEAWPEVYFWMHAHHANLSLGYIMSLCYIAGLRDRDKQDIAAARRQEGLPPLVYEDQHRVATFKNIWTQVEYLQLSPTDMAGS